MTDEEEFSARSQLKWRREGDAWILSCRTCCGVGDPCHVISITAATMITQVTTL